MERDGDDRKRVIWLALFVICLFSVLAAQFFYIQVVSGDYWSEKARRQHYFFVEEPFVRGTFYSNPSIKKGHPEKPYRFVVDVQKFHLHADPESIPGQAREPLVEFLSDRLELTSRETAALKDQLEKSSRDRLLAMWLSREARDEILAWWKSFAKERGIVRNALFFVSDYQRSYPFGKMLGHALHTVQNRRDEATKQAIPTGGLELSLNSYLQGKLGKRQLMRSPRHSMEWGQILVPPENGADIYLTINHYLQAVAEEELEKGVKKSKAKGGWAVIMNPYTGEILALAQYPFFYPPQYREYFNDPERIVHTRPAALTDAHEPGSILKPFAVMAALMANNELKKQGKLPIFDPEEKVACSDGTLPGRQKPMTDVRVHKYLNLPMAMQKSSNIYMALAIDRVINSLGEQWYRNVLADVFAFGTRTGLELPGESPGVLPMPGKLHPNGKLEWSRPTPYSLAIGHNLQLNSIQILRAWSLLANGGVMVEPTLVRKIVKEGRVLLDNTGDERAQSFPQVVDQNAVAPVVEALRYDTMPGGTGTRANIPGFTEVGKSGTSRKIENGTYTSKKHLASFVGFAPADRPEFVLLVTIDEPEVAYIPGEGHNNHGGVAAAPVFREIAKKTLEYLGTAPDNPHGYPPQDPRYDPDKAKWVRETRLLREKYNSWNK